MNSTINVKLPRLVETLSAALFAVIPPTVTLMKISIQERFLIIDEENDTTKLDEKSDKPINELNDSVRSNEVFPQMKKGKTNFNVTLTNTNAYMLLTLHVILISITCKVSNM